MRALISAIVAVSIAAGAAAALSKEYAGFPTGPAQLLLTAEEKAQWNEVETDAQAKAFIDAFWARRDPTAGTPENEYRNNFDKRVKNADINYSNAKQKGSVTDRGKVYVLMGLPTNLQKSDKKASNIQSPATMPGSVDAAAARGNRSVQAYTSKEVWIWDLGKSNLKLGQPKVELIFVDQYDSNEWKLDRLPSTDPLVVFERVAKAFIFDPGANDVPAFVDPSTVAARPAARMTFTNDALRAAIDEIRAGKAGSPNLFVTSAEFVTPTGDQFVPVQLYAPIGTGLEANAAVTFFGAVEKGGETIAVFEQPATLLPSNGAVYVARSLVLTPGEYRAIFGVAAQGKPPVVTSATTISVAGIDKDAAGVSPLILSNHVYSLAEAQAPTDPYTFGGLRVVPKSDGAFRTNDELWYFIELRNPGLDAASKAPKLTVKLSLTGKTKTGTPVKMISPAEETPAQELKGVPGHWAVGQSIPLDSFKPGEYTLAVKVTDQAANHTYDLTQQFRIVE